MQRLLQTPDYCLNQLTRTEKRMYNEFKKNHINLKGKNITMISSTFHCSPAVVISMLKKIGYNGFSEFKVSLNNYNMHNFNSNDTTEQILSRNLEELNKTVTNLSREQLKRSVNKIKKSEDIVVVSSELTDYVASEFVYKLIMLDKNAVHVKDKILMEHVVNNDRVELIVIFSLFANTSYLYEVIKDSDKDILLITSNPNGIINQVADYLLISNSNASPKITQKYETEDIDIYSRLGLHYISSVLIEMIM